MSGLPFILTPTGRARLINPENTGTSGLTISHIGVSASDAGVVGGVLQGEIKRLDTFAGQVVADDTIHVTIRDDSADVYSLRAFALYFEDGTLMGWHAQPAVILEKSAQAMLLMSGDFQFQNLDVTTLTFGDSNWTNPVATTTVFGVLRLATNDAALSGVSQVDAVTPAGLLHVLNSRFGVGAPSAFVKDLLGMATAALFRAAIGLGSASLRNEGAGNGLDADLLDGQHGAYYRDWANLTSKPASFPPSAHGHAWNEISGVPSTAARWPTFAEVTDKPVSYPPSAHSHAAADVLSGVFDVARIPDLSQAKITGLAAALAARVSKAGDTMLGGLTIDRGVNGPDANREFAAQNGAHYISLHARMNAGSYNPIVQAGDKCIIWTNGAAGTGALTIAPWSDATVGLRMAANGEATLHGDLTVIGDVPTAELLAGNRAFGYRILANVANTVDYGLQFDRWAGTQWQTKAMVTAAGFRVEGQMVASLANGAQYRATANGANFFDFGIGASTTDDPDAYLVNRANGAILIYTNNTMRGSFRADGVLDWTGAVHSGHSLVFKTQGGSTDWTWFANTGGAALDLSGVGPRIAVTNAGELQAAGGFRNTSSRRVKDIEGPNPYGLDEVLKLETVVGAYKKEFHGDGARRVFLVAENVAEHIDGPVRRMDGVEFEGETVLGLDYQQLVPVLVRAIQELTAEVRALKAGE